MLCRYWLKTMKYLTQRSYIGRTGEGLHRARGVVSLAATAGWRHHETALNVATILAAPVTGDEEDVAAELNIVLLALPLPLL